MRKKNYKGRCEKRTVSKCNGICRTYDDLQNAYLDILRDRADITEIRLNIPLDSTEYMTDFVCIKADNEIMVRECVEARFLKKPLTIKLLDISRDYWLRHGVADWGIVTNEAE